MKETLLLFLLSFALATNARQLHTIKSGNWEADSVWFNNMKPLTTDDTISIHHHIALHTNIILSTNAYLIIDSTAWLCGNDSLTMLSGSRIFNQGFLGLLYFEMLGGAQGLNLAPGYIDLGYKGMYLHGIGTRFIDSLGCVLVHVGMQECAFPCANDTSLSISLNYNQATFETHNRNGFYYDYDFGDGTSLNTFDSHVTHTYSNPGEFWAQLIIHSCCGTDTVQRKMHVEMPPPPCIESRSFLIFPDPADEGFWIQKEFCAEEKVVVKIYTITGQLANKYDFTTYRELLKEFIPSKLLASACYIVGLQSSDREDRQRIAVVHQ